MENTAKGPSLLILVNNDGMGKTEPELQHKLVTIYLKLLDEHDMLPGAICFYADGVKLVVEGPAWTTSGSRTRSGWGSSAA